MAKKQSPPIVISFWMPVPVREAIKKSVGVPLVTIEETTKKVSFYVNGEHIVTQVK